MLRNPRGNVTLILVLIIIGSIYSNFWNVLDHKKHFIAKQIHDMVIDIDEQYLK